MVSHFAEGVQGLCALKWEFRAGPVSSLWGTRIAEIRVSGSYLCGP